MWKLKNPRYKIMPTIHDWWLRLAADLVLLQKNVCIEIKALYNVLLQKNVCIEIKALYNVAANPTPPP